MKFADLGLSKELLQSVTAAGYVITSYSIHYTKLYDLLVYMSDRGPDRRVWWCYDTVDSAFLPGIAAENL